MPLNIPKYCIIKNDIIELIENAALSPDELVPSETKLMQQYNVSRITARRALDSLSADGYIYKIQGKGCFVKKRALAQAMGRVRSYTEEIMQLGKTPSRRLLESEIIPCDKEKSSKLKIAADAPVYKLKRIYFADSEPLCLTTAYIPADLFKGIEDFNFEDNSLYDVLENRFSCRLTHSSLRIKAAAAGKDTARFLRIKNGTPILLLTSVTYGIVNERELPVEYFKTYYLTDNICYTLEQYR